MKNSIQKVHEYCAYLYSINQTNFTFIYNRFEFWYSDKTPIARQQFYLNEDDPNGDYYTAEELLYIFAERLIYDKQEFQKALGEDGIVCASCSKAGLSMLVIPNDPVLPCFDVPERLFSFED